MARLELGLKRRAWKYHFTVRITGAVSLSEPFRGTFGGCGDKVGLIEAVADVVLGRRRVAGTAAVSRPFNMGACDNPHLGNVSILYTHMGDRYSMSVALLASKYVRPWP